MTKPAIVWKEVEDLLDTGGTPVITLSSSTRVLTPKNRVGRPRVRKPGARPFAHYEMHTPSGWRMTCRANGCTKRLRRGQVLVCSEQCSRELRESCELYLSILRGEIGADELPPYMRTDRLRKGAKSTL
jgi:hypothetical protein